MRLFEAIADTEDNGQAAKNESYANDGGEHIGTDILSGNRGKTGATPKSG
jgi:hypothetical protein